MSFNKLAGVTVTALVFGLLMLGEVNAAALSVKCGVTGASRSNITIAGSGLRGRYYAIAGSGGRGYKSPVKATNVNGVLVFNFDSHPAMVAAGATRITATFIKDLFVAGFIRKEFTHELVAAIATKCISR